MLLMETKIRNVPVALLNKVKKQAKKEGRSMNKQIIHLLKKGTDALIGDK